MRELAECKTALVETCVGARAVDEFGLFRLLRNLLLLSNILLQSPSPLIQHDLGIVAYEDTECKGKERGPVNSLVRNILPRCARLALSPAGVPPDRALEKHRVPNSPCNTYLITDHAVFGLELSDLRCPTDELVCRTS